METETISNVLKWIFLLERDQPVLMSAISITLKISRLLCTFLTGTSDEIGFLLVFYIESLIDQGAVLVMIVWLLDLQLPVQSVPITTKVES
jgi:hypothetical protein